MMVLSINNYRKLQPFFKKLKLIKSVLIFLILTTMSDNTILDKSEPSVCIPRTFPNITWKRIKDVFEEVLGAKCIDRIDMVRRRADDGSQFQRVFIHFTSWPSDERSQEVRNRLLEGKDIKIVYDEPWFWKCSASRVPRPRPSGRRKHQTPYIDSVGINSNKRPNLSSHRKHNKPFLDVLAQADAKIANDATPSS